MASLKEVKGRISSINGTLKIITNEDCITCLLTS